MSKRFYILIVVAIICYTQQCAYAGGAGSHIKNVATSVSNVASASGEIVKTISNIIKDNKESNLKIGVEALDIVQDRAVKVYELHNNNKITTHELENALDHINYSFDYAKTKLERGRKKNKISNNTIHYTVDNSAKTQDNTVVKIIVMTAKTNSKVTPNQTQKPLKNGQTTDKPETIITEQ